MTITEDVKAEVIRRGWGCTVLGPPSYGMRPTVGLFWTAKGAVPDGRSRHLHVCVDADNANSLADHAASGCVERNFDPVSSRYVISGGVLEPAE